ncbi:MAG: DUF2807 domain-containing protein [Sphingomonas sp.]|uniref:GIN domain-containing protein n=1 Tax=Sphingomonas sp. TaxID=28214 RepID=UPI0012012EEF|nr:DUF2807 domain-containing protein [Sphingomonas sp.]THD38219.1 MAG: DUF2807 domain-containing protein [Sphingomonas sp.]
MRLLPLLALPFLVTAAMATDGNNDRGPGLTGERQGDTTTYRAMDFDKVAFGLAGDVDVRVGPAWSVRATGPAAAFANLRIVRENGTLEIAHRYRNQDTNRDLERQVHFVVTLPRIAGAMLGGSGRMTVDRVRGSAFEATVGGSGSLSLGTIEVDRATVAIGGSGGITARGSARSLAVSVGGSGSLQAPDLRAASARVSTAGSGIVRATVDGPATVSVVGSGQIDLGRNSRVVRSRA